MLLIKCRRCSTIIGASPSANRGVVPGICVTCQMQEDPDEAHRLIKAITRLEGAARIEEVQHEPVLVCEVS